MVSLAKDDLIALESLIKAQSNGRFFFGGDKPNTVDCVLYGVFTQLFLFPVASPLAREVGINDDRVFPNLRAYANRLKKYVEGVSAK